MKYRKILCYFGLAKYLCECKKRMDITVSVLLFHLCTWTADIVFLCGMTKVLHRAVIIWVFRAPEETSWSCQRFPHSHTCFWYCQNKQKTKQCRVAGILEYSKMWALSWGQPHLVILPRPLFQPKCVFTCTYALFSRMLCWNWKPRLWWSEHFLMGKEGNRIN